VLGEMRIVTPVVDTHGVVVGRLREMLLGIALHPSDNGIVGRKVYIIYLESRWPGYRLRLKDELGIRRYGCPPMLDDIIR
jgi:hypothetical protein